MALAALVLGISSIILSLFGIVFGATAVFAQIIAIQGIIIASIGLYNRRKAGSGLTCSLIGATISIVPALIFLFNLLSQFLG